MAVNEVEAIRVKILNQLNMKRKKNSTQHISWMIDRLHEVKASSENRLQVHSKRVKYLRLVHMSNN